MGLINCKIHGESGVMSNASIALCENIKNSVSMKDKSIMTINVIYKDNDGEFLFDENYFFTKGEVDELTLKNSYEVQTDNEERSIHNLLKNHLEIECVECFKSYMKDNNIEFKFYNF